MLKKSFNKIRFKFLKGFHFRSLYNRFTLLYYHSFHYINVSNNVNHRLRKQERLATLLEGVGLAFDIQKCLKFQKSIMVVLKL